MCHLLLGVFSFFTFHILLELRANLTVRRNISVFCDIHWSYEEREWRKERKEENGGEARGEREESRGSSYAYYTPSLIGFGNPPSVVTVQDEGSRHNLSGILIQLPDLTTQIIEQPQQPQQKLYTITTTAPPQQQQPPQYSASPGGSLTPHRPFSGPPKSSKNN